MAHKNLIYESREPAFLQKLRAQAAGGSYQDRVSQRPKRLRNPEEDEEDEPVYVLDDNTTLTKKEFDALNDEPSKDSGDKSEKDDDDSKKEGEEGTGTKLGKTDGKSRDSVLDIGVKTHKRKIGKVIGGDAEEHVEKESKDGKVTPNNDAPKKKKAKSKGRVKLSFGTDD